MTKVFIDGSAGTTGLKIRERLSVRKDVEVTVLADEVRKDPAARLSAAEKADVVFLCLPDDAAREAAAAYRDLEAVIIDTSTAHRCDPGWTYGMPELGFGEKIAASKRIANPGCHATGFIALAKPLRDAGLLRSDAALSCFSLTGYSGGGKKMIASYEDPRRSPLLKAPGQYALSQSHKHLPEMKKFCSLEKEPVFCPVVGDFYSGMEVTLPLFKEDLTAGFGEVRAVYEKIYRGPVIAFDAGLGDLGTLSAALMSGKDSMKIGLFGNEDRMIAAALFDNLGKGASGAAIQNMNVALGLDETLGLEL